MSELGYWNFDMSAAPKPGVGEGPVFVWLATNRGRVVLTFHCFSTSEGEHWRGMLNGEEPIAWMPYEAPKHPHANQGGG